MPTETDLSDKTKVPITWMVTAAFIGVISLSVIVGGVWWAADLTAKVNTLVAANLSNQALDTTRAKEITDFRERVSRDIAEMRDRMAKDISDLRDKVLVLEYRNK
jgi:predicted transcriptional regulator